MTRRIAVAVLALGVAGAVPALTHAADPARPAATQTTEAAEVKLALSDCPTAVQKAIKKAVGGGKIEAIEKETEGGKTTYEVDAKIDGKDYEIKVADNGALISKKLDDEKDEKGEHEDAR